MILKIMILKYKPKINRLNFLNKKYKQQNNKKMKLNFNQNIQKIIRIAQINYNI